jgi:uncharacterized protein YkwD
VRIPTLRSRFAAAAIAMTLALGTTGCAAVRNKVASSSWQAPAPSSTEKSVIDAVNRYRAARGLRALPAHETLMSKARFWAVYMANGGCGRTGNLANICHSTLTSGINVAWTWLAENVGMATPQSNLNGVIKGLEQSPSHQANILSTRATSIGVGIAYSGNAVYLVQEFMQGG